MNGVAHAKAAMAAWVLVADVPPDFFTSCLGVSLLVNQRLMRSYNRAAILGHAASATIALKSICQRTFFDQYLFKKKAFPCVLHAYKPGSGVYTGIKK